MTTTASDASLTKRKLLLHDGAAFLLLTLIAASLFGVTLFLFRSFEEHRADLAKRWALRAMTELNAGRPERAILPLRTALSYAPDDRAYALMLAQALGDAGHTDEATNYFLNLWDARPGDGFINLELARLERRRDDPQEATNHYRAAVYGNWEGDGVVRRRDVRLELARYLIEQHQPRAAQTELEIAAGNAPDDPALDEMFGDRFREAGDAADAMAAYKRAIAHDPHKESALAKAGSLAYDTGSYVEARSLLARAVRESPTTGRSTDPQRSSLQAISERVDRIVDLAPFRNLPATSRAERVLRVRAIARNRMDACMAGPGTAGGVVNPALTDLVDRWSAAGGKLRAGALTNDEPRQEALLTLAYDTELQTEKICGPPADAEDVSLLRLAQVPFTDESRTSAGQGGR